MVSNRKTELNNMQIALIAHDGKKAEMIDRIVDGQINKWSSEICLLNQKFVKNPGETLIAVLMLLWFFGFAMYGNFGKGTLYFAEVEPVAAEISIRARGNFSANESKEIMEVVEAKILEVPDIENLYLTTGSQWFNSGGDTMARGFMEVVDSKYRNRTGYDIIDQVEEVTSNIPGIIVETSG